MAAFTFIIITSVSPNCYCMVKLWLNDTAVDEHKHMRGENIREPRKPRDYKDQFCLHMLSVCLFHDMVSSIFTPR